MAGSAADEIRHEIAIAAPAKGWVVPLEVVPDPAFSSGALGQGVGIELLDGAICAPCDGTIAAIAAAGHAITLETATGAQILIHCGIDTVALAGAPFRLVAQQGGTVSTGDLLMQVDLEAVAQAGKSLATPVVLVEPAGHRIEVGNVEGPCEAGTALFTLIPDDPAENGITTVVEFTSERSIVLPLPHGLHARPAAAIAAVAAGWAGPISIVLDGRAADARSTTGLMKLGAVLGSELIIRGGGPDAEAAVEAVAELIARGAGDDISAAGHAPAPSATTPASAVAAYDDGQAAEPGVILGVAAAPGQALGAAYYLHRARIEVSEASQGANIERARLAQALDTLRAQISDAPANGITGAHLAILGDAALIGSVEALIAEGESAAVAWQQAMSAEVTELRALPDPRLAERADDFADLEQQLLRILTGKESQIAAPAGSIVIASDLYPSDLAPLAEARVAGIATLAGGPTSHLAILAASAGIPMAVAFGKPLCAVEEGEPIHLDGDTGRLRHALSDEERGELEAGIASRAAAYDEALAQAGADTHLASGERIEVFANLGSVADAEDAVALHAEGSGLLRTEFLFLDRASPPDEDEQAQIYGAIMDRFDGKPVIIRTLDIGADKPAPYLPLGQEDNPALGVRGIRVGLRHRELLATQIRAILRGAGKRTAHIMAPMIASIDEVEALRALLDQAIAELGHSAPVKLGAMVETPASALIADALAARLDFLSVGTNDLTQYALAMDRTNPELAAQLDPMHPAVLRLIAMTGKACSEAGKLLGVCGSAAGDQLAAPVLVGLGVTELSASAARIPELKQQLRGLSMEQCRAAAEAALAEATPQASREAAAQILNSGHEG